MDLRYPETLKEYGKPGAKKDGDEGAEDGEEREHPAIARVRCMMGREIRVKVVDGRVFVGRFECYDKQGNILMEDAMSTTLDDPEGTEPHAYRGMIIIQKQHRVETQLIVGTASAIPPRRTLTRTRSWRSRSCCTRRRRRRTRTGARTR